MSTMKFCVLIPICLLLFCQSSTGQTNESGKENKMLVLKFLQEFFQEGNVDAADKFVSENCINHFPEVADGREALKTDTKSWLQTEPKMSMEVRRSVADDNHVWVHSKCNLKGKNAAVVDIFRMDKGMIVEWWSVVQDIPEKSLNGKSMV